MESTHQDVGVFQIGLKAPITNRVKVELLLGSTQIKVKSFFQTIPVGGRSAGGPVYVEYSGNCYPS